MARACGIPDGDRRDHAVPGCAALHDHVSRSTLRANGDAIELNPGVAHGLARLAGLLKPALEIMWVEDVRRMNKFLDAEVPDVAGHLFGRERTALAVVRAPFKQAFGPHCFYCGTHLPANNPIDHVLPWSLRRAASIVVNRLVCRRGRVTRRSNDWTLASRRRGSAPKTVNTNPTQSCHAFVESR